MSYSKWMQQLVYVFKLRQSKKNTNNNCYVTINCTNTPTPATSVLIMGLYDEYLHFEYDEYAKLSALRIESDVIEA